MNVQDSSGYAGNVIDGVVTEVAGAQPIGCNLIGGALVCPVGGGRGTGSERPLRLLQVSGTMHQNDVLFWCSAAHRVTLPRGNRPPAYPVNL